MNIATNYAYLPARYARTSQQLTAQPLSPHHEPTNFQPAFKAKQEVIVSGLYKKYSSEAKRILETINQSDAIIKFKNKYVETVALHANMNHSGVSSSLFMKYNNPYESTFKKMFRKLFGKNDNIIEIHGWGIDITEATDELCKNCGNERGCLHGHITLAMENMNKLKEMQNARMIAKMQKQTTKAKRIQEQKQAEEELKNTIATFFEK